MLTLVVGVLTVITPSLPKHCPDNLKKENINVIFLEQEYKDLCFLKMAVFWVIVPCSLVQAYRHFRGACCLHHQGDHPEMSVNFYQTTWRTNPEDSHLHTCCHENLKSHLWFLFIAPFPCICMNICHIKTFQIKLKISYHISPIFHSLYFVQFVLFFQRTCYNCDGVAIFYVLILLCQV
jgi:hypothetical protein